MSRHVCPGAACATLPATACRRRRSARGDDVVDRAVVERLVAGDYLVPRTLAELTAAVLELRKTLSITRTAERLRCNKTTVTRRQAAARTASHIRAVA